MKISFFVFKNIKPIKIFTDLHIKANLEVCHDQLKERSGIYGIINLHENKIYIGKSINIFARFKQHIKKSSNGPLKNAIAKDGLQNFAFVVFVFVPSTFSLRESIGVVDKNTQATASEGLGKDQFYIQKELSRLETEYINSFNPKFLYNIKICLYGGDDIIIITKNIYFVTNNLALKCINKSRAKLSIYQIARKFLTLF